MKLFPHLAGINAAALLFLASGIFLASCGGGGGGTSSTGPSDAEGIRIAHTALDGAPVIFAIDDEVVTETPLRFSEVAGYKKVAPGKHSVTISEQGAGVTRTINIDYEKNTKITVLFSGGALIAKALVEPLQDNSQEDTGGCPTVFIHGVDQTGPLSVKRANETVAKVSPLSATVPVHLPDGINPLTVVEEGGSILWRGSVTCEGDKPSSVILSGTSGYFVTAQTK
jgi:hypothetical protein